METFTVFLDFEGGTYVHQVQAETIGDVVAEWSRTFVWTNVSGLDSASWRKLCHGLELGECPTPVEGNESVWCTGAGIDHSYALLHIVKTSV